MDIDRFTELAGEMADEIPDIFMRELNGGILIVEDVQPGPPDLPDVCTLGEYIYDPDGLGRYIVIYHGSFAELFAGEPDEVWEDELWETILHELQHHLEFLAGIDDLGKEDAELLEEFRRWADGEDTPRGGHS